MDGTAAGGADATTLEHDDGTASDGGAAALTAVAVDKMLDEGPGQRWSGR